MKRHETPEIIHHGEYFEIHESTYGSRSEWEVFFHGPRETEWLGAFDRLREARDFCDLHLKVIEEGEV